MAVAALATWADTYPMDLEVMFALRVMRLLSPAKRRRVLRMLEQGLARRAELPRERNPPTGWHALDKSHERSSVLRAL
jgi:hypothetical protein